MARVTLTRRYCFCASHRLHTPLLTVEENSRLFGKCNNPYGHGHNYALDVSVTGELDPVLGRLVRIEALDDFVKTVVLGDMAHRNLNTDVEEFAGLVPTTENLAAVILRRLGASWAEAFPGGRVRLERIRIYETKNNTFEALAPDAALAPVAAQDRSHLAVVRKEER